MSIDMHQSVIDKIRKIQQMVELRNLRENLLSDLKSLLAMQRAINHGKRRIIVDLIK